MKDYLGVCTRSDYQDLTLGESDNLLLQIDGYAALAALEIGGSNGMINVRFCFDECMGVSLTESVDGVGLK